MLTLCVVYSDAWFWPWTGTTTPAPLADHEGSGTPTGSWEIPAESLASTGPEIMEDRRGRGQQSVERTWQETTEALHLLTVAPTVELERTSADGATEISPRTSKPGHETSSLTGTPLGGSIHEGLTGNVEPAYGRSKSALLSESEFAKNRGNS